MLITFKIQNAVTKPGEGVYIVGNSELLGHWSVSLLSNSLFLFFEFIPQYRMSNH